MALLTPKLVETQPPPYKLVVGPRLTRYAQPPNSDQSIGTPYIEILPTKISLQGREGFFKYGVAIVMAKKSWLERDKRKLRTVQKYAALRAELRAKGDYVSLAQLPRDASPTRLVNRCQITGRRRAFIRRFRLSRITFRELASAGLIPGVTRSSW